MDSGYKMGMVIQFHMISCHGVREKVSIPNLESNSWMTCVKRLDDHNYKSMKIITAHLWCDSHFTSISTCELLEVRAGVQVSRRKFYTHIHLD